MNPFFKRKRIIRHGRVLTPTVLFTCQYCGCIFEMDEDDTEHIFDRNTDIWTSYCPECHRIASSERKGNTND